MWTALQARQLRPIASGMRFVTAVLTQRDAGGNLAEVLDNLASVIRDQPGGSIEELAGVATWRLVQAAERERPPLVRLADRWALWFLLVTLAVSGGAWWLAGDAGRGFAGGAGGRRLRADRRACDGCG